MSNLSTLNITMRIIWSVSRAYINASLVPKPFTSCKFGLTLSIYIYFGPRSKTVHFIRNSGQRLGWGTSCSRKNDRIGPRIVSRRNISQSRIPAPFHTEIINTDVCSSWLAATFCWDAYLLARSLLATYTQLPTPPTVLRALRDSLGYEAQPGSNKTSHFFLRLTTD